MIITSHIEKSELGQPHFRFLMSDLHLGSLCSDHGEIVKDLDKAKALGARILINGDIFDCIGARDKRFDLATLHPSISREKDLTTAIVDIAKEILMPYRDLIDVIGIGNHEEMWISWCNTDPVRRLIHDLNQEGGHIKHGSFWGYIRTKFVVPGYRKRPLHRLLYLHGTGGDSPVTKGTIDFNRKGRSWQYDALTFGHKHNLVCTVEQIGDVSDKGIYAERKQLNLQTGSYFRNYRGLTDGEALDYSYAARMGHPPKPIGGLFLVLRPMLSKSGELVIEQDFCSDVVFPWKKHRTKTA